MTKDVNSYVLNRSSSSATYEVDQPAVSEVPAEEQPQQLNTSSEEENNSEQDDDVLLYVADEAQTTPFCDDVLLCYSFML